MLTALLADVHGNREALVACLDDAERANASRYIFLGDLVGYGPDPAWVVERVTAMVANGAVAIKGNHDAAAVKVSNTMGVLARTAIEWTKTRLTSSHLGFLATLPLDHVEDDRLYVHASASAPQDWIYMLSPREAFQSFRASPQRLTFCGHTHIPALFNESASTLPQQYVPVAGQPIPLLGQRRWIAVLGAVGQPRDDNPAACYGLLDTASSRLTYVRVPYDADLTARKILKAGLPQILAKRVISGT